MTHYEKSRLKNGISVLFAFLLSLLLFFLSSALLIQSTLLSPDYMRNQLGASHYYDNVSTEVENEFASYASASGFDEPFFKTVLDMNDVQLDVNRSLSVLYGESVSPESTSNFENKLYGKLIENVKNRGIDVSSQTEAGLHLLAKTCSNTYLQYISIPYAAEAAPVIQKIRIPLILFEAGILLLILLLAVMIFRLNHWRHRAVRAYLYAVSGTVLMLAVAPAFLLFSGRINRISLISSSMYAFAVTYFNGILTGFLLFALFFLVLDCLLILLYRYNKKKAYRAAE